MGYYIEVPVSKGKADAIVAGQVMVQATGDPASPADKFSRDTGWRYAGPYQAEILKSPPASYDAIPEGRALVVVVDNGLFEAAGFAYDEAEFAEFTREDGRRHEYVLVDRWLAELSSGYAAAQAKRA